MLRFFLLSLSAWFFEQDAWRLLYAAGSLPLDCVARSWFLLVRRCRPTRVLPGTLLTSIDAKNTSHKMRIVIYPHRHSVIRCGLPSESVDRLKCVGGGIMNGQLDISISKAPKPKEGSVRKRVWVIAKENKRAVLHVGLVGCSALVSVLQTVRVVLC